MLSSKEVVKDIEIIKTPEEAEIKEAAEKTLWLKVKNVDDLNVLIKQYEIVVNYVMKRSENRTSLNSFYISIPAAIIPVISYVYNMDISAGGKHFIIATMSFSGAISSWVWSRELRRYAQLAEVTSRIIAELEDKLPSNPFDAENKMLNLTGAPARLEKQERLIPYFFSSVYIIVMLFMLYLSVVS